MLHKLISFQDIIALSLWKFWLTVGCTTLISDLRRRARGLSSSVSISFSLLIASETSLVLFSISIVFSFINSVASMAVAVGVGVSGCSSFLSNLQDSDEIWLLISAVSSLSSSSALWSPLSSAWKNPRTFIFLRKIRHSKTKTKTIKL